MDAQFSFELLDNGSNENNAMRLIELSLRISFQNSEEHFPHGNHFPKSTYYRFQIISDL